MEIDLLLREFAIEVDNVAGIVLDVVNVVCDTTTKGKQGAAIEKGQ